MMHKTIVEMVDQHIIEFDIVDPEQLKKSINNAFGILLFDKKIFLTDFLERAEKLECYNVCVAVRDLLKELENEK